MDALDTVVALACEASRDSVKAFSADASATPLIPTASGDSFRETGDLCRPRLEKKKTALRLEEIHEGGCSKQSSSADLASVLESISRDVGFLRCASTERKLESLAAWSDGLCEPPCDLSELPRRLQAALLWVMKQLKKHHEAIGFVARTVKPWEDVLLTGKYSHAEDAVEPGKCGEALAACSGNACPKVIMERGEEGVTCTHSHEKDAVEPAKCDEALIASSGNACEEVIMELAEQGGGSKQEATPPGLDQSGGMVPAALTPTCTSVKEGASSGNACSLSPPCPSAFDALALSWMVKTEGALRERGSQFEKLENSTQVLRARLDKFTVEMARYFKKPPKFAAPGDASVMELFCNSLRGDSQAPTPGNSRQSSKAAGTPSGETIIQRLKRTRTNSLGGAENLGISTSRRPSSATLKDAEIPSPSLSVVTHGELSEVQRSVTSVEESIENLYSEFNRLLLQQTRRLDDVEHTAEAHFTRLRELAASAAGVGAQGVEASKRASEAIERQLEATEWRNSVCFVPTGETQNAMSPLAAEMQRNFLAGVKERLDADGKEIEGSDDEYNSEKANLSDDTSEDRGTRRCSLADSSDGRQLSFPRRLSTSSSNSPHSRSSPHSRNSAARNAFSTKTWVVVTKTAQTVSGLQDRLKSLESLVTGMAPEMAAMRQALSKRESISKRPESAKSVVLDSGLRLSTIACGDDLSHNPKRPPSADFSKKLSLRAQKEAQKRAGHLPFAPLPQRSYADGVGDQQPDLEHVCDDSQLPHGPMAVRTSVAAPPEPEARQPPVSPASPTVARPTCTQKPRPASGKRSLKPMLGSTAPHGKAGADQMKASFTLESAGIAPVFDPSSF